LVGFQVPFRTQRLLEQGSFTAAIQDFLKILKFGVEGFLIIWRKGKKVPELKGFRIFLGRYYFIGGIQVRRKAKGGVN